MQVLNNPHRLAKLLASINVHGTMRPLEPIDTAYEISIMLSDLNNDRTELVKRLPISLDIIKQFLRLLKLPPEIQDVIVWGESKKETGSIGFSVASRLAQFDNQHDVLKMVSAMFEIQRPVTKDEIKIILSLKKHNPKKSIEDCIKEVLNVVRTSTIQHYLFLSGLKHEIIEKLKKISSSKQNIHEIAFNILQKVFPQNSLKNTKVFSDSIRLSLTKQGKDYITEYSQSNDLLRRDVVNHMFESSGILNE